MRFAGMELIDNPDLYGWIQQQTEAAEQKEEDNE